MRLRETLPCPPAPASVLTTAQAAVALGYSEETVAKMAPELGGYRRGSRGPWRFPVARIEAYKGKADELRKPNATLQALAKEVEDLKSIGIERDNRHAYELDQLRRRLASLEKRSATAGHLEIAA
jgi:hypothetical protein